MRSASEKVSAVCLILASLALLAATGAQAKAHRADVCHITGNGAILRLTVAQPAVQAHLDHGDHLPITFWADTDADGFGAGPASDGCVVPDGFVENDDDCDDDASSCTTDCVSDDDLDGRRSCQDRCSDTDLDGWGDDTSGVLVGGGSIPVGSCTSDGATPCDLGPACLGPDCDDGASSCTTVCADGDGDGRNDCRDQCLDGDGDGYGVANGGNVIGAGPTSVSGCTTDGSTPCALGDPCLGQDCDDANPNVNPGETEVCNGIDDDCENGIDDGLTFDDDLDGFTTPASCEGSRDDCDDSDPNVNPGEVESCNGTDDDCDGDIDEGLTFDDDLDGFTSVGSCEGTGDDCDDNDPNVNPGETEICNDIDDDCDGGTDEGGICASKKVFVSSATYDGNFGAGFGGDGLAGADAECQTLATNAGLGGTFKAWISGRPDGEVGGGGQDVQDRFIQSSGPYELVNGTQVADDWADLTDGTLDHAIDRSEVNLVVTSPDDRVWTNTRTNGNAFDIVRDCALNAGPHTWTCTPGTVCPFESGNYGFATATNSTWTTAPPNNTNCAEMLRLYCFEQ